MRASSLLGWCWVTENKNEVAEAQNVEDKLNAMKEAFDVKVELNLYLYFGITSSLCVSYYSRPRAEFAVRASVCRCLLADREESV